MEGVGKKVFFSCYLFSRFIILCSSALIRACCSCMALVKVSRLAESPGHRGRDGYVDAVAYLSLAAQLATTDPTDFDAY